MKYTLIDYTRGFHRESQRLNLSANVRSLYTALLSEMNETHYPERLVLSDRQMQRLSGIKSLASVHEAKNVLKNHGLIEFRKSGAGVTEYELRTEHLTERQANEKRTAGERPKPGDKTRAREEEGEREENASAEREREREKPTAATLSRISRAFGVDVAAMLAKKEAKA